MADQENKVTHDTKAHRFSLANGTFVEYVILVVSKLDVMATVSTYISTRICLCCLRRYSLDKEVMDMYHTVTPPECRGKGYAGKVVRAAVDYCKDKGFKV